MYTPDPDALSVASLEQRDIDYHIHPFTDLDLHARVGPMIIDRGEGVYLFDSSGRKYLDGMSSLWCATLGYSEKRLIEASHEQMCRLPYSHTFRGRSTEKLIELAQRLVDIAPAPLAKVLFANSGSESNDSAIKLAWYYNQALGRPEKRKIISRHGAYHGSTIATASLCGLPAMHLNFNLPLPGIVYADQPHYYRFAQPGESEEDFSTRMADNLEALIRSEGADSIGAFIAEPVMGVGGVIVPPRGYFEKVQTVLRKYDILFIVDEVICGFGRTGNMFGCNTFGIEPDMMVLAKGLSAAYFPISALLVSAPIYDAMLATSRRIGNFSHGLTYSGHPVGAAVALETLQLYQERDILGNVRNAGARLQAALDKLTPLQCVGDVRGVGLMAAIEFVSDKVSKTPFDSSARVAERVVEKAQAHGLFLRAVGDTVVIAPPLIISKTDMEILIERLSLAVHEVQAELC